MQLKEPGMLVQALGSSKRKKAGDTTRFSLAPKYFPAPATHIDFHPCIHQFLEEVQNIKLQRKLNYLQKNEVKACIVNYTITNAPISCVARPARAVI